MKFNWPNHTLDFDLKEHTILVGLGGSHSYGTNLPESDIDYRGILIPPIDYYFNPYKNIETFSWKSEEFSGRVSERDGIPERESEGTLFALNKFIALAADCNPNVIEILFLDPEHYFYISPEAEYLIANREKFLTKRALYSFSGYATSQLKRIETHRSWLQNPPKAPPDREKYGLPPEKKISGDQQGAADAIIRKEVNRYAPWLEHCRNDEQEAFWESINALCKLAQPEEKWPQIREVLEEQFAVRIGFDSNFIDYLKKEKAYDQARVHYKQYKAWLKNRNPARAELESKYGYDAKHAMHLVRLIRMGEEVLTKGTLTVYRPDREELKEIRNGAWSYDELVSWTKLEIERLYKFVDTGEVAVPDRKDEVAIGELNREVLEMFYNRTKGNSK